MTWLTVQAAAELRNVTESAMWKAVKQNRLEYRYVKGVGRGGKQLLIALESLPQEAQDRYNQVEQEPAPVLQYTGKQREAADFKALISSWYDRFGGSIEEFVRQFNEENPPEDAITVKQLYRWHQKYKSGGVAALIDKRGGHNRGDTGIPPDAWEYFYAMYMTQQKRSVKLCWDKTRIQYPDIPSVSSFERQVRKIPKLAILYYREGPKVFNDNLPYMDRDKTDIQSNYIWYSDHHRVDVFIKSADGLHAVRPWLTVFFDARSNKVISYFVRFDDPDATVVKKCFRLGVEQYGLPNEVSFDNGKDYRAKKSFSRDYPLSLVNQLGIGVIYATPYHGAAKTVERFFGTFTNRFSRLFPTYTGKDAKNRPECMRTSDKNIVKLAPTLAEYVEALDTYIEEYNHTPSKGKDMEGKCPEQVYFENLKTKRVISNHEALRLLCGNSEERVIHKNGVSFKNNSYFHETLLAHVGERVIVTYDPDNLDQLAVFDMENRAICMAQAKIRTPFRHTTEADYNQAAKSKKAAWAVMEKYRPVRELSVHELIARQQLMEKRFEETGEAQTVEHITPQAARNAEIIESTNQPAGSRRIRKEDSISETLMELYERKA